MTYNPHYQDRRLMEREARAERKLKNMQRRKPAEIGERRIHKTKVGERIREKTADGWRYVPTGKPRFGNGPGKNAKTECDPSLRLSPQKIDRSEGRAQSGSANRIVQTRSNTTGRPAYSNGQNPAQVKVREQTGKWVRVDGKTWKLKAA